MTLTVFEKVNVVIAPQDFSQILLLLIKFHYYRLVVLQYGLGLESHFSGLGLGLGLEGCRLDYKSEKLLITARFFHLL
jgi:hypothetical protein